MPYSTGNPDADAADDFNRVRRSQLVSRMINRLRGESDIDTILPFDEVVSALGMRGQRHLGTQQIPVGSIVGTVDRTGDFDRRFRPTTSRPRRRFEKLAASARRGDPWDPIDVYRVGEGYFVQDGHHRVAVARAMGIPSLEARVTDVQTGLPGERALRLRDLPAKSNERLFRERVPLPAEAAKRVRLSDPTDYGNLAENVEAWGYRAEQSRGEQLDRATTAKAWFDEEYEPVVELLRSTGLLGLDEPETDGYLRLASDRWRLLQTWDWDDDVIERLRRSRSGRG